MAPPVRRSAPPYNPAIESWLDAMPPCSTSPSPEELRQWRLDKGWKETWLIASITLRASSLVLALVVFIITLVMLKADAADMELALTIPPLVVCPLVTLWDATDLITLVCLRNRAGRFYLRAYVDLVLFFFAFVAMVVIFVDMVTSIGTLRMVAGDFTSKEFAQAAILICLAAVHAVIFFLCMCNCFERRGKEQKKPRNMDQATSQLVVVLPGSFQQTFYGPAHAQVPESRTIREADDSRSGMMRQVPST